MKDYIVTVLAQDRVGILRDVSSALAGISGNITHLSQTVMRGYFTHIISVEVPDERTQLEIKQAVERNGDVGELEVNVRPFGESAQSSLADSEGFTLSMQGNDQKGIIARTTTYLADQGINIDDFYSYVHEGKLLMLAQVSVPREVNVEEVQAGLERVGQEFGLVVHMQHEDIFRATSDVRPMSDLEREAQ